MNPPGQNWELDIQLGVRERPKPQADMRRIMKFGGNVRKRPSFRTLPLAHEQEKSPLSSTALHTNFRASWKYLG